MKANGLILGAKRNIITVKTDSSKFRQGDMVKIQIGKTRTLKQNKLYWQFLKWATLQEDLKNLGHYDPDALHINIKAKLLSEKTLEEGVLKILKTGSTTELDTEEFKDFIDQVNLFMIETFQLDTSLFWDQYEELKLGEKNAQQNKAQN